MQHTTKVSILGTEYQIEVKKYDEEEAFARCNIIGRCSGYEKTIQICDMTTHPNWKEESPVSCAAIQREITRHEIIHAFLDESGLGDNAHTYNGPWTQNEEMVDWIAQQHPKLERAFREAGCAD